ncbi:MAG: leucine-rich repeat domain-containing protein [Fibrobacteria bacterium]|nr:leucine-rich repeat domain-containing protein [Fibrobacteria bacterium]
MKILRACVGAGLLLAGCGQSDRWAGGTGSETGNTIAVRILNTGGDSVPGAQVFLRDATTADPSKHALFLADSSGSVRIPAPNAETWMESVSPDGHRSLEVLLPDRSPILQTVLHAPAEMRFAGLEPHATLELPGLGRTLVADGDGAVVVRSLPLGVLFAQTANRRVLIPVGAGTTDSVRPFSDSGSAVPWPDDGSLDSLAVQRLLDRSGLSRLRVDSICTRSGGRIHSLRIDGQDLTELPLGFGSLGFLKELSLNRNGLRTLPSDLRSMQGLEALWLVGNPLGTLPEPLRSLGNLRILKIDSTGIDSLPEWLGDLRSLEILRTTHNGIRHLPASLTALRKLRTLTISYNPVEELPRGFHHLDSLRELWAASNQIPTLPDSFSYLPSLRVAQLVDGPLQFLPEDIGRLSSLRDLRISQTPLRRLPLSVADLSLDSLDVWKVALCDLDPSLETWVDSLAGTDWRSVRANSCP